MAAFDFDGTLTWGGSVVPFLLRARGPVAVAMALLAELPTFVRAGLFDGAAADEAKERVFVRLLAGMPVERLDQVGKEFAAEHLRRRLRSDTRARLEWHRAQGHLVVVVSASPECYVGPAAAILGADGALATRLEVSGGLVTGRYQGRNCRGTEKHSRLTAWIRAQRLDNDELALWAYGNSRGDRRLLEAADHGIDAGRLGKFGRLRRFPRLAQVAGGEAGTLT